MNKKENTKALIRGSGFERIGIFDHFWGETLRKWTKEEAFPLDGDASEYFDLDMRLIWGVVEHLPLLDHTEVLEESDEWIVTRNGAGAALKHWKQKTGTPEHIDFLMTSRAVWDRDYRDRLIGYQPERLLRNRAMTGLEKGKSQWTFYGDLFVWEIMRQSMGDICMYESLLLDPDWIHDFCRVYTDFFKVHYGKILTDLPKPDGIWIYEDLGYKNGLFCSLKLIRELLLPYYTEIVQFFHSQDLPVILHSCGGIGEAIPTYIEAGFDGLNPMEVKAGCDILRFADLYSDELVFVGGLDVRILETGDRDLIRAKTVELMEGMKQRGARFVFGTDHSVSSGVAYDDYRFMLDVYRENMYY